ncbi:MAG TPA: hypothetical protein VMU75_14430 [Acidimicrobiales bacterium]|nr:hypothetical protein [Acidimicrobiales bacterium]
MAADRSEISSISSLLTQLTTRVVAMGEAAAAGRDDALASELFGVERSLDGARRRLERLLAPGR